jgi:hypothetical protein
MRQPVTGGPSLGRLRSPGPHRLDDAAAVAINVTDRRFISY